MFPIAAAISALGAGASFFGQQQATDAANANIAMQNAIAARNAERTNKYNRRLVDRQNEYNDKVYARDRAQWRINRQAVTQKNKAIGEMVRIQSRQEQLRMDTMRLEAEQQRREAIRQALIANAQAQVAGTASGTTGGSGVEGAMAANTLMANVAERNINRGVAGAEAMMHMNRNLFQQNAIVSRQTRTLSPIAPMTQIRPPLTGAMLQGMQAGGTLQAAGSSLAAAAPAIAQFGEYALGKPTEISAVT